MYAAHDAFHRDLRCLTAAAEAGRSADPAVRTSWATFKNHLHVHHTAEDTSFWPPLRQKVTRPGDAAVLDAMEAEHAGTAARTVRPGHRVLVRADGPGRRAGQASPAPIWRP